MENDRLNPLSSNNFDLSQSDKWFSSYRQKRELHTESTQKINFGHFWVNIGIFICHINSEINGILPFLGNKKVYLRKYDAELFQLHSIIL